MCKLADLIDTKSERYKVMKILQKKRHLIDDIIVFSGDSFVSKKCGDFSRFIYSKMHENIPPKEVTLKELIDYNNNFNNDILELVCIMTDFNFYSSKSLLKKTRRYVYKTYITWGELYDKVIKKQDREREKNNNDDNNRQQNSVEGIDDVIMKWGF